MDACDSRHPQARKCSGDILHHRQERPGVSGTRATHRGRGSRDRQSLVHTSEPRRNPLSLTELELNATQRLIESEVGRSTVLFRPPYFGDAEADKPQEVEPALVPQNLGYVMVGVRIDPDDWQLPSLPIRSSTARSIARQTRIPKHAAKLFCCTTRAAIVRRQWKRCRV